MNHTYNLDYIGKLDKGSKKHSKIGKHKHFMSYDAKSNLKYYDFGTGSVMDNSMDKIHKRKKMVKPQITPNNP